MVMFSVYIIDTYILLLSYRIDIQYASDIQKLCIKLYMQIASRRPGCMNACAQLPYFSLPQH